MVTHLLDETATSSAFCQSVSVMKSPYGPKSADQPNVIDLATVKSDYGMVMATLGFETIRH